MISQVANAMRLQALRSAGHKITSRYGIVTGYDPNKYSAKALIQPENIQSGFLQVATPWSGNGWGFFAPPVVGSQVVVCFVDGDLSAGFILCSFFNSTTQSLAVPSGEFWAVHKRGAFFKLTNDGKLTISDGNGATLLLAGNGNIASSANNWVHDGPVSFNGNVTVDGDVSVTGTLDSTGDGIIDGVNIKTHVHSGVQSGGSPTGPPV